MVSSSVSCMNKIYPVFTILILFFFVTAGQAQSVDSLLGRSQVILAKERIFSIKGLGMAFPIGGVSEILRPRFSSSIGYQILSKNRKNFIFPAIDYLNYKYDQKFPTDGYNTKNANAKFYMGTLSYGYIKSIKQLSIFGSAGIGGGLVNEPRATIDDAAGNINFRNKSSFSGIIKLNTGIDYGKRRFKFFAEVSYMQNTKRIESHNLQTLAFNIGTKSNLFRLAKSIEGIRKK